MEPRQTRLSLRLIAVFIGYMIASQAGLLLATINQNASPFWPATGFAIFCAITIGNVALLPIGLAAFLTNYLVPSPLPTALLIAAGNTLEAFVGYRIFIAVYRRRTLFAHLHEALATVGATALGALASATLGVAALYYTAELPKSLTIFSWLTWYSGDIVGGMTTLPFLLELRRCLARKQAHLVRNAVYSSIPLILFSTLFSFAQWTTMLFVAFPLALLALSYGSRMAAVTYLIGVATVCAIGTWFTEGPFSTGNTNINLLYLVLFLFSLALSTVVMISYDRIGVLYGSRRYFIMVWIAAASLTLGFELFSKNVDEDHFRALTRKTEERLLERMEDYTRALSGGVALIRASETVTRTEWRSFAETFSITSALPGVYGIGFIRSLPAPELDKFVAGNRKSGAPYFSVKSLGEIHANDHFVIQYLEPIEANRSAIGLDIGSESRRRAAAELSRDTGHPAITESIFLIQDTKTRPGFLLFSPVYRGSHVPTTVDDRRRQIFGWVYAPFVTGNFFEHALESTQEELDITVYERGTDKILWTNRTTAPKDLRLKTALNVTLAQRQFQLHIKPSAQFNYSRETMTAWVSTISSVLGLLAIGVLVNLTISRRRIERLVDLRTREAEYHRVSSLEASRLASLGEMAGGIAHEINNPLAIIVARTENLLDRLHCGPVEAPEITDNLKRIHEVSQRIAKIVAGMRRLVRDDSESPLDLYSCEMVIEDALDLCREKYRSRGIQLTVENQLSPEGTPLRVHCRRIQVAQVLVNLLNNAEHATEGQSSRWIKIRTYQEEPWINIEITDSGGGIPPAIANRMMDPFFTTKEVGKGTGLGLAITRSIMNQHHGRIEYLPERNNTTFVLRFPIKLST